MVLCPLKAKAQMVWTADEDTEVFSEPNVQSRKLGIIKRGKTVEWISTGQRWIRIRVKTKGKKLMAFVRNSRPVRTNSDGEELSGWTVGGYLSLSYIVQSGRIYKDSDGNETEISNLSGSSQYAAVFTDWLFNEIWTFRGALVGRKIILNGTAKYRVNVAAGNSSVELKQDFFGLFFQPQLKLTPFLNLWVAPGVEMAFGTKSIVFNVESEKPTYFFGFASVGTRHNFGHFYLTPELRAGAIINSKPVIINGELIIAGAYAF